MENATNRNHRPSIGSISYYPSVLGVPSLLVTDEGNSTYHLKGLLSEQERESMAHAAKAVVEVEIGSYSDAEKTSESDARLAKSTILRLAILLRIPGSPGIFPKLTRLRICRPKTLDILPLLVSPSITDLELEHWDHAREEDGGAGSRERDLVHFLKTLASRTGGGLNQLALISTITSPDIIHCIRRFSSITLLSLIHVLPSGQAGSDMLESVFEVVSSLANLVGLTFYCAETDITIKSSLTTPRPLRLGSISLYLTGPVYKALRQHFCLTATRHATIGLVFRSGFGSDDQRRPEIAQFSDFFSPFIARSPITFLLMGSHDPGGFPNKAHLPVEHLEAILRKPTLTDLSLTGWILVRDEVVQAIKNPSPFHSLRNQRQMRELYFSYDCSWDGFTIQDFVLIAGAYPRLTKLTAPFKLEVPPATGWDVGTLGELSPLTELRVYERGPGENVEELSVRDNIEVVKYLKRVFPKLKRLECEHNVTGKVWNGRWLLVKELFEAVAKPRSST